MYRIFKIIVIFFLFLSLIGISGFIYGRYLWGGIYLDILNVGGLYSDIQVQTYSGSIQVVVNSGSSGERVSDIMYSINGNNIFIWAYEKPIPIAIYNDRTGKLDINLLKKGQYKLYYLHQNGASEFIKDISIY